MTAPEPYRPSAPSMRALGVLAAVYEKLSGVSGRLRPPVVAVDRRLRVRVGQQRREADDVVSLRLEPTNGLPLPAWQPGAHVDVELPSGRLRQYSLCGDPDERDHYRIAVRRLPNGGGGSVEIHALTPGSELTLRGPRNAFPFITTDRYLFVAGGIGVTPILPMVRAAVARGADWTFVYTGRTTAAMPFLAEVAGLDRARVHVWPDDEHGVPNGQNIVGLAPHGAALYACGPPPMIEAIRASLPCARVSTLHYERFSPPPVVAGSPFEIVLARSGHVVPVAADQTALTAVRSVLPDVAYSCQQGFCGTCPVSLIGGAVEHRDRCLTDAQRTTRMALCVSRGRGRVTLDL